MKTILIATCIALSGSMAAADESLAARSGDPSTIQDANEALPPQDTSGQSAGATPPSSSIIASVRRDDPQAQRLLDDARRAFDAGQFDAAANNADQAAKRSAAAGQRDRYCDAAALLSAAQSALGRQIAAIGAATKAIEVAQEIGDARREAQALAARGRAAMFSQQADLTEDDLLSAEIIAARLEDHALQSQIANDQANLYAARGQTVRALDRYDTALAHAQAIDDKRSQALIAANAALAAVEGAHSTAAERAQRATELVDHLGDDYFAAHVLITLSDAYAGLARSDGGDSVKSTRSSYNAALLAANMGHAMQNPTLQSHAWGRIGQLYAAQNRNDEALSATRRAVFFAQQAQSPDAIFRFQWQLGRLLRDGGQIDPAIDAYRRALSILTQKSLSNIRHDLAIGYGNLNSQKTFRQTIGPVFFEAADLLLRKADQVGDPALQQESLRLARDTIEDLKSAELEDYFQDDCVNLVKQKARGIDVGLVNTAIVYLIPLADRTELLVSTPAGLKRFRGDVSEPVLTAEVKELRARLEDELDYSYRQPAAKIYDWLIRPIESALMAEQVDTLVFVPDGELRTIPMAALLDRDTNQHLIEKFAVAVSPGLELTDPRPLAQRQNVELLAAGLSEARQNFPALPSVPRELAEVTGLFGGVQLKDETFQRSRFADQFRGDTFTIVHIASHGKFAGSARDTFVLTYDGRLSLDDLEKLIQPSQFRGEPVELLTLSACQTAAGEDSARAALGLAGIAIKAGARSALASLWSVNDAASSQLIGDFYQQLRDNPTQTKSKALQEAQVKLLKQPNTQHPRYWAPYLIIGNWL